MVLTPRPPRIHRRLTDMEYGNLLQEPGALDALGKHASVDKAQALTEGGKWDSSSPARFSGSLLLLIGQAFCSS